MSVPRTKTVTRQQHEGDCPAHLDNDEECICFYQGRPETITVCACCGDEMRARPCQRERCAQHFRTPFERLILFAAGSMKFRQMRHAVILRVPHVEPLLTRSDAGGKAALASLLDTLPGLSDPQRREIIHRLLAVNTHLSDHLKKCLLSPAWNPDAAFMVDPDAPSLGDNQRAALPPGRI